MKERLLRIIGIPLIALIFPVVFHSHDHKYLLTDIFIALICAWIVWEINRYFIILLRKWLRWELKPVLHILVQAFGSVILVLVVVFLTQYLSSKYYYNEPINDDLLKQSIVLAAIISLMINAIYEGLYFSEKWKATFTQAEILKRETLQSHFESLKNQVSPHFMFNCLNTIAVLIEEDKQLALKFNSELISLYRYVIESQNWKLVSLERELQFTKTYAFLLQMRFGDGFQFQDYLDDKTLKTFIPPLTLQMLLENAVKHNVVSKKHPLLIELVVKDNKLIFSNKIQKKNMPVSSTQIGLKNIANRYKYFGVEEIEINNNQEYFEVKLPLLAEV